MLDKLVAV